MEQQEYLDRIHGEILTVMDEVHRVCTENNLKYYLIGGTLLGAVRHGGFIPWDDDLDIVMPRMDYEQFIKIAPKALRKPFYFQWITTNKRYPRLFAKVANSNTCFFVRKMFEPFRYPGIFVDIFPLDESSGYSNSVEWRKKWIKRIEGVISESHERDKKSLWKRFMYSLFPISFMHGIVYVLMTMTNGSERKFYTNFGSHYNAKKQTMPKEYYGQGKLIAFEDRHYIAPENPNAILSSIFGSNYMELPPIEKRETHLPKYVKFSDGSECFFQGYTPHDVLKFNT